MTSLFDLYKQSKEVMIIELSDIECRYEQIKDYPDYYITEHGEIYSMRRNPKCREAKLRKLTPKRPGNNELKYYNITLCRDDGCKSFDIHRLVAEYFVDGKFEGAVVNHIDGNNRNNDASNLEWITQKENIHKSYITSGKDATRNYKYWDLYNPDGDFVGSFIGNIKLQEYVLENDINASGSSLVRYGYSRGYTVQTRYKHS